jgi:hypothetical protein
MVQGLIWFSFFSFLLWILRRQWIAFGITMLLYAFYAHVLGSSEGHPAWAAVFGSLQAALGIFIIMRCGLTALIVGMFVGFTLATTPITFDWSKWYVWHSAIPMVLIVSLAVYGFVISLGGQPLLGKDGLGDE